MNRHMKKKSIFAKQNCSFVNITDSEGRKCVHKVVKE